MTCTSLDLSIVIVNYNGWSLLAPCLKSIQRTATDLHYEIWVVDNGSTDGSVTNLRRHFSTVRCIQNRENLGFARANNQAIPKCTGRHILLLNNDTLLFDGALQTLVRALDAHRQLAAVGPQLHNRDGSIQPSCMRAPTAWSSPINYLRLRGGGSAKFVPPSRSDLTVVDAVTGACLLMRAKALAEVGLLDGGYFMYAEESDWCYRARRLGWQIGYTRAARVTHLGGQTAERQSGRFYVERRVSRVRFKLKHLGRFPARLDAILIQANIKLRWLANPRQRDYYTTIDLDFRARVKHLFRQFPRSKD